MICFSFNCLFEGRSAPIVLPAFAPRFCANCAPYLAMTPLSCRWVCLDNCFKHGSVQRLPQGAQTTVQIMISYCHPSANLTANRIAIFGKHQNSADQCFSLAVVTCDCRAQRVSSMDRRCGYPRGLGFMELVFKITQ